MATVSYADSYLKSLGVLDVPQGFMCSVYDSLSAGDGNLSAADIWEALSIPAGSVVTEVGIAILTAEGGTATADVGLTGVSADGFLDGVNLNAAAGICYNSLNTSAAADTYSSGHYFSSADTIDVLFNNAMDAGKYMVWCRLFDSKAG
jgi:hypothetical protein